MKEIDFVAGRYRSLSDDWQTLPGFDPAEAVFTGLTGPGQLQVWDHDNFSRDDFFGEIRFSDNEAGHGHITGVAARDGAHYVLVFEIVAES